MTDDSVIISKGAIRLNPNELAVLPSNLDGDAVLVKSTEQVSETYNPLNHESGRIISRSEAKEHSDKYDYVGLRERIYIPEMIKDTSIKTEAPFCYRDLDD